MNFIDEKLEEYCISKSSLPSSDCEEIQKYTLENEHWSVMLTGKMEASFLGFLIRLINAKRVLEFGTFTGYSALSMAENLPEDGEIITLERDPRLHKLSREFWDKSPHGSKIKSHLGDALNILEKVEGNFDFAFIDADKVNYLNYLNFTLERLNPNGMIAIDNVLWSGKVLGDDQDKSTVAIRKLNDHLANREDLYITMLPIRDGITLIQKRK